jgi:prepilin-type N-terminal cleavage/methylation domain-containing protein
MAARNSMGFTLVELMITVVIAAILLGLGLTSIRYMLISARTKSTADSILAGLQLARAEAIRRNAPVRFQLLNTMDDACVASATGQVWAVTQSNLISSANNGIAKSCKSYVPYLPPDQPDPCNPDPGLCPGSGTPPANCRSNNLACTDDPWFAYKSNPTTSNDVKVLGSTAGTNVCAPGAVEAADAAVVTFGAIGQITTNFTDGAHSTALYSNTLAYIKIAPVTASTASDQAVVKTWCIRINTTNGNLKLCDPSVASTDPMAC